MKSYNFRRKYKKEAKPEEDNTQKKEIVETKIVETTVINNEFPKKVSDEIKEKYRFRKREKKNNLSDQKEKEKEENIIIENKPINIDENKKIKKNKLKEDMNEIERVCTEKTLKKDLMELYERVLENNAEFKDKIFFKNLLDTEKKVGKMDSINTEQITHTFKEIESSKILRNIENGESLLNKYTLRAKRINEED